MASSAPTATMRLFGRTPQGEEVMLVTLAGAGGMTARIMTWGGSVQSVVVPDRQGTLADVTLGHATLDEYLAHPQYFGATCGRFANRIARGRFSLDGRAYQLACNDGANALHGGLAGFDKANWQIAALRQGTVPAVTMRHVSPDGEEGYPGTVTVEATFSLRPEGLLAVDYTATTDAPTILNLTNHAYWNLAGEGAAEGAMEHWVSIFAEAYLPTDTGSIPTGEVRAVAGTAFDFRAPRQVSERLRDASDAQIAIGRGYDHNFVLSPMPVATPRPVARAEHRPSGRTMTVWSDQPGLQFYSGNFLDGRTMGKSGRLYRMGDAVVFEPQLFPDAPNQPAFASARLDPGETYRHRMGWQFSVDAA